LGSTGGIEFLVTLKLVDKVIDRQPENSRLWVSHILIDKNNALRSVSFCPLLPEREAVEGSMI